MVRFTPRRAKSVWSQINVEKVARLSQAGLMQPSGFTQVNTAQADGRWDAAYGSQNNDQILEKFLELLSHDESALVFYNSLNKANKYAITFRITTAVGEEKKQRVMEKIIEKLKSGKSFH